MLLTIALLLFALHIAAWMVLPASAAKSEHVAGAAPEFALRAPAVSEA